MCVDRAGGCVPQRFFFYGALFGRGSRNKRQIPQEPIQC